MKTFFKKGLSVLLSLGMLLCVLPSYAEEGSQKAVTIRLESQGLENASSSGTVTSATRFTNFLRALVVETEGYTFSEPIRFVFGEELDESTLTAENITIQAVDGKGAPLSYVSPVLYSHYNTETGYVTYTPYSVSSTDCRIDVGTLIEGHCKLIVIFKGGEETDGVKTGIWTKSGEPIQTVVKNVFPGRVALLPHRAGKSIMDVAYRSAAVATKWNGSTVKDVTKPLLKYHYSIDGGYSEGGGTAVILASDSLVRVDLGNYFDISDLAVYSFWGANVDQDVEVYYSNTDTYNEADLTKWGTMAAGQYGKAASGTYAGYTNGSSTGFVGYSKYLHPDHSVRARYVYLKGNGDKIVQLSVFGYVDTVYESMTATKDGAEITETGAGSYTVTCPVHARVAGTSDAYMIVAGYDANGAVTKINCAPVSLENYDSNKKTGTLSLTTTFGGTTAKIKAVIIKSISEPYMLTDALVIE